MAEPSKPYQLSSFIGTLCVTHDTNVHKLRARLGVDPAELLRMFNGRAPASKALVAALARELDLRLCDSWSDWLKR
jgi:hypothetical protein